VTDSHLFMLNWEQL